MGYTAGSIASGIADFGKDFALTLTGSALADRFLGAVKTSAQLGSEGETAVRGTFDIGEKLKISINGRSRVPDGLTLDTLSEVKNVARQSLTSQLRDYADYAADRGLKFNLYTRSDTKITGPLQQLIDAGIISRLNIPK